MVEMEVPELCNRKQTRQPPSVPFLWEVKPGMPKKDWKPEKTSVIPVPRPPVKLVASVPFEWEETPGKPLPCFSQPPSDSPVPLRPVMFIGSPSSSSVYSQAYDDDADDDGSDGDDEQDGMFELDLEAFGFETDESFSLATSLLANQLPSTVVISTAVPMQETSPMENTCGQPETPSSQASETDSSTSSYATGTTGLVGASFLECLFPLLPPNSGFLEKVGSTAKGSLTMVEQQSKDFERESNCSVIIRRPPTLGELIMMSRRRSYRRKAVQMRNRSLSMEFMKKRSFGCCLLGISNDRIGGLLHGKWKKWPRLKLE